MIKQSTELIYRFRRRNSSLENLNEIFLNDETSDKPKEDRIVKFKDELAPERGRSRSRKSLVSTGIKPIGASILKDSSKSKNSTAEKPPEIIKSALKSGKKSKAPAPPAAVVLPPNISCKKEESKQTADSDPPLASAVVCKQTADICKQSSDSSSEDSSKDKEESGYDSDQTLATLSAKDSASEASSINSPASSVKKDLKPNLNSSDTQTEIIKDCDSDVEQDLSLESIITQNEAILKPIPPELRSNPRPLSTSNQPLSLVLPTQTSEKFSSLDPTLMSSENITSVEVGWLSEQKNSVNTKPSTEEDDELKALCEEERSSVTSSIPMDFGESLPPTLTTLMHKQFLLYRLYKEPEAELGVLITKKIQRDRRTSGYVIAYIEPDGLVDKDGRFKVGDELINVNGHSLRGLSMEAARNVLRQLSGHVDIIVARQPQEANQSSNAGLYFQNISLIEFFRAVASLYSPV